MYFDEKFFINDEIYCEAYIPQKDCPVVIYAHSLGMSYRSGYEYFRELLKQNIGCVTFDFGGWRIFIKKQRQNNRNVPHQ